MNQPEQHSLLTAIDIFWKKKGAGKVKKTKLLLEIEFEHGIIEAHTDLMAFKTVIESLRRGVGDQTFENNKNSNIG